MKESTLNLVSYINQAKTWPNKGRCILAQFDTDSITVYQAYNQKIAEAIVTAQTFHADGCQNAGFKLTRTTWIKTNFLWMMYRSNWARSQNQERILKFRITRRGFEELLGMAAVSKTGNSEAIRASDVVLQWDPDHKPNGEKIPERRAVQLGLRGSAFEKFSKEYLIDVDDITEFVVEQRNNLNDLDRLMMPFEQVYDSLSDEIRNNIEINE